MLFLLLYIHLYFRLDKIQSRFFKIKNALTSVCKTRTLCYLVLSLVCPPMGLKRQSHSFGFGSDSFVVLTQPHRCDLSVFRPNAYICLALRASPAVHIIFFQNILSSMKLKSFVRAVAEWARGTRAYCQQKTRPVKSARGEHAKRQRADQRKHVQLSTQSA
jgi:hypothetical protein